MTYDQEDDRQDGAISGEYARRKPSTQSVATVSTRTDTLPGSRTSAHAPISDDQAISGDSTISSGRHGPSVRETSSRSSPSESTQIKLDSLLSVRSIETPEAFRRQLVEGPDTGLRSAEDTYHPPSPAYELPVTGDNVHKEMILGEYDSMHRCVSLVCGYHNRPLPYNYGFRLVAPVFFV